MLRVKGDYIMASRALEFSEYKRIIELCLEGFVTKEGAIFRPNRQIALAFQLQASLGLRIGDVLNLRINNFNYNKLDSNSTVSKNMREYIIKNRLSQTDKLFKVKARSIQKQLRLITAHLGLENISTHSFRKLYAATVYKDSGRDLELVQGLLNHSSVSTTLRYIKAMQQAKNQEFPSVEPVGDFNVWLVQQGKQEWFTPNKGIVYILTNPAYEGIVKIGRTWRNLSERIDDLNRSGFLLPFQPYAAYYVENSVDVERQIHVLLNTLGLGTQIEMENGRIFKSEFYVIPAEKAFKIFRTIAKLRGDENYLQLLADK